MRLSVDKINEKSPYWVLQLSDMQFRFITRNGIEAHKSYTGYMRIHVSPDVHSRVAALAKRTGVSINAFVSKALDNQIAKLQP